MSNRCQIDPWGGEGEADSRVGSGGPVPNKPLTTLRFRIRANALHGIPSNLRSHNTLPLSLLLLIPGCSFLVFFPVVLHGGAWGSYGTDKHPSARLCKIRWSSFLKRPNHTMDIHAWNLSGRQHFRKVLTSAILPHTGAGNGRANFMGAWIFFGSFYWKTPRAHKIPPFRGFWALFRRGGRKCQFYFYGRGDFSEHWQAYNFLRVSFPCHFTSSYSSSSSSKHVLRGQQTKQTI